MPETETPVSDEDIIIVWRDPGAGENEVSTILLDGKVLAFPLNDPDTAGTRHISSFGQARQVLNSSPQRLTVSVGVAKQLNPAWEFIAKSD